MATMPALRDSAKQNSTTSIAYPACSDGTAAAGLRYWSITWVAIQEWFEEPTGAEAMFCSPMRTPCGIQPSRHAIHGGAAGQIAKVAAAANETVTIVAAKR